MKTARVTEPSLEELATAAVRLGRELCEMAHAVYAGGNTRDFGFVSWSLARLRDRTAFDDRDEDSLNTLMGILEADIRSEVVGTEQCFFETASDMDGVYGEYRDCAVYSDRGEVLLRMRKTLDEFRAARAATLDRIAAERAVLRLMSG